MAMMFNRRPTVRERIPEVIQDGLMRLGMDTRKANTYAYRVAGLLDWTPVGAAAAAWDSGVAAQKRQGLLGKAAGLGGGLAMAALGAVPGGRKAAAAGEKLAMDEASRMARAAEQGFTLDAYHATRATEPFDYFRTYGGPQAHDLHGVHVGTADAANDRLAQYYKGARFKPGESGQGASVLPLKVSVQKPYTKRDGSPYSEADIRQQVNKFADANGLRRNSIEAKNQFRNKLLAEGYDAIPYRNTKEDRGSVSYLVFDPANIRSRFAAFDPAKRNSRDLLAGFGAVGGAGTLGLLAQPQQREY